MNMMYAPTMCQDLKNMMLYIASYAWNTAFKLFYKLQESISSFNRTDKDFKHFILMK